MNKEKNKNNKIKYSNEKKEKKIFILYKRKLKNINQFYYKRVQELINDKIYKEVFLSDIDSCVNEIIEITLYTINLIPLLKVSSIKTDYFNHFDEYINI